MADNKKFVQVLHMVIDALNELDNRQLQAIIEGKAEFRYVILEMAPDPLPPLPPTKPAISEEQMTQWEAELKNCAAVEEGVKYVSELKGTTGKKLTTKEIKAFAQHCNCRLGSGKKQELIEAFVRSFLDPLINPKIFSSHI